VQASFLFLGVGKHAHDNQGYHDQSGYEILHHGYHSSSAHEQGDGAIVRINAGATALSRPERGWGPSAQREVPEPTRAQTST
jgi:hypothetical protein